MKKIRTLIVLFVVIILSLPLVSYAGGEINKANDLMKAGIHSPKRINQAIDILEGVLTNDPDNYKVYLMIGEAYMSLGNYSRANQEFKSANEFKLCTNHVVRIIINESDRILANGKLRDIVSIHEMLDQWGRKEALNFQQKIFTKASQLFNSGKLKIAINHFDVVANLNNIYKQKISDFYFKKGDIVLASKYSTKYNAEIYRMCEEKMKASKTQEDYNYWNQLALKCGIEIIDYIVYNPGKPKVFDLAPYQESDLYVRLGDETMFGHVSRPKNNFGIRFRSGKVVKLWKGEKIPKNIKEDFKVFANDEKVKVGLAFHPYDAKKLAMN